MGRCVVISPVYNDWPSFTRLLKAIDLCDLAKEFEIDIIAVDDGSVRQDFDDRISLQNFKSFGSIEIIRLVCNLGHQRAIAIGLAHVARRPEYDFAIVMDSDGEDRPEDLIKLAQGHLEAPRSIIVGQRARRSETAAFRALYQVYKRFFTITTGRKIDFGNFCLIPSELILRITFMSELWNHLAATIIRSKLVFKRVPTVRGSRYCGRSNMDLISLTTHGLSAMAAFSDVLFVRILVASAAVIGLGVTAGLLAISIRIFTGLAIPGWSTAVVGFAAVGILQGFSLSVTAAFMTLSNRTALVFVPAIHGPSYIRTVEELKKRV